MYLYNSATHKKEEFKTHTPNHVEMYTCGPTVYHFAHIGNLRSYIMEDVLEKYLRYTGYDVTRVMNITDVGHLLSDGDTGEDKMEAPVKKQQKSPYEIAAYYTDVFFKDIAALNIGKPEIIAKATDHIADMLEFVEALVDKGYGYETSDGIYFDISKFPGYGKLSGNTHLDDNIAGARVDVNTEKRNPADFALWKKAPKEHIMQWDSPWGRSYPGWHIECSTMARKYLGDTFDIHTGGVDHIPIHHENEIAQSEALLGHPAVNYWMHVEFMQVDGRKMSKSLGNTYTLDELAERGYSPMDFRYFCLNTHYRKKLNFTFEGMDAARTAYARLLALLKACKHSDAKTDPAVIEAFDKAFAEAVSDDLNIPLGMGELWTLLKNPPSRDIYDAAMRADAVLGLSLDKCDEEKTEDVPDNVRELAEKRRAARQAKDWATSDALRGELTALGWAVKDTAQGPQLSKL